MFNFMAGVTIFSDFGAPKIKSLTVSIIFPSICHEVMGPDVMRPKCQVSIRPKYHET